MTETKLGKGMGLLFAAGLRLQSCSAWTVLEGSGPRVVGNCWTFSKDCSFWDFL